MRRIIIKKSLVQDNNLFVAFFLMFPVFMDFFNQVARFFVSNTHRIDTFSCYFLLLCLLFSARKRILRELNVKWLLWSVIWIGLLATSILSSHDKAINIEVINYAVRKCLPAFVVATLVSDTERLWRYLKTVAYLILGMIFIETYVIRAEGFQLLYDLKNQYASYQAMVSATVFIICLFESFSWGTLIALIINLFMLLTFGERTPFIAAIVLFLVMLLLDRSAKASKNRVVIVFLIIVLVLLFVFSDGLINALIGLMGSFNMSSRMAAFLLKERSLSADAGRSLLYSESLKLLKSNWILGVGFVNERFFLHQRINWSLSTVHGMYPHNIFLELLIQTGVIIGSALIVLILDTVRKTYRICKKSRSAVYLFLFFFFNGLFPLIGSGSYINWVYFYSFVGFCATIISKRKRIIQNEDKSS